MPVQIFNSAKQGMCFFLKFDHLHETKDLAARFEHLAPSPFERLDENKGLSNQTRTPCSPPLERLEENKGLSCQT
jgi:hypothetical protein